MYNVICERNDHRSLFGRATRKDSSAKVWRRPYRATTSNGFLRLRNRVDVLTCSLAWTSRYYHAVLLPEYAKKSRFLRRSYRLLLFIDHRCFVGLWTHTPAHGVSFSYKTLSVPISLFYNAIQKPSL